MRPPSDPMHLLGHQLTALTMGIDRFERGQMAGEGPLDTEGLVPIYLGDQLVAPEQPASFEEALHRLDQLEAASRQLPASPRQTYLTDMIDSVRAATQLFAGQTMDFAEKLQRLVGVPAQPVAPAQLEQITLDLLQSLGQAGYRQDSLAQRVERWETDRFLAPDQLEAQFKSLMAEAQQRTNRLVFDTGSYSMALNLVKGVPYTARCSFARGQMDLNADLQFTPAALKHLVAHEVFPGHSTQLLATLHWAQEGTSPPDVLLCTANTVVGAVQEGIGDQGLYLIDWVDSLDDAIYLSLRRLRTAAATSAAWYLMAEGWPQEKVRRFLQQTAFPQPAWLEGRLRFAAHPFRGPFLASYWFGDEAVASVRRRVGQAGRQPFVRALYGTLNSVRSLEQYE